MRFAAQVVLVTLALAAIPACGDKKSSGGGNAPNTDGGGGEGDGGAPAPRADETLGDWSYAKSDAKADLNAVSSMYGAGIFAVGDRGTLLVSTDEGKTWTKKDLGTEANLHSIAWVNDTFYVGGDHVVFFSKDAGQTFTASAVDGVVRGMAFTSSGPGQGQFWVAGDGGFVAKAVLGEDDELDTFDVASLAWEKVTIEGATDLTGISFSFSTGIVAGKGGFAADSTDLGATWERVETLKGGVDYLAIDDKFVAGDGVVAKRSTPNGWPAGSFQWQLHGSSDLPRITGLFCVEICELVGQTDEGSVIMTLNRDFAVEKVQAQRIGAKLRAITNLTGVGRIVVGQAGTILVLPDPKKSPNTSD